MRLPSCLGLSCSVLTSSALFSDRLTGRPCNPACTAPGVPSGHAGPQMPFGRRHLTLELEMNLIFPCGSDASRKLAVRTPMVL